MAGLDPTGQAGAGIKSDSNESLIHFTEDIRGPNENNPSDEDTDDPNEDITYTLDDKDGDGDTDLVRNNRLIAENIKSLLFDYLDGAGNTTATLSAIRFVDITLIAVTDDGSSDRTMTARIHCRNLRY